VEMETEAVGMGTVFTGTGRDGVQFLSPCRPLVWIDFYILDVTESSRSPLGHLCVDCSHVLFYSFVSICSNTI